MQNIKINLIKRITPNAVLLPLTKEASQSITKSSSKNDLIAMKDFPFKIGRESRLGESEKGIFIKLRIASPTKPNNDIYLLNNSKELQISKEHFQIEKKEMNYFLKDRGSSNGMTINGISMGGKKEIFEKELKDGDIIKIGNEKSKFEYQFLILENIQIS
ncbi:MULTISPECIES: FHA domain-containing protein [Arcobacteraceae]|uniref:FHA domain-containing protein n=1 Tax=Poseidonibacter parvus TaxID=1850254 RepID=A0A1P8KLW9_9BACT|nr:MULTISPECIES: FHA domain-containing protein [Arcobacteraceae]APW65564.1 hypothetical protein LPB137_06745 [Poseidonibacter parvus]